MTVDDRENTSLSLEYRYHPMQMHLHTCHQPGGSMEGHIANAAALGMRYIRFTDHDNRLGPKQYPVNGFDFTSGSLRIEEENGRYAEWTTPKGMEAPEFTFTDKGTVFSASGNGNEEWMHRAVSFASSGKRHTVSLLATVTLTFGLSVVAKEQEDTRVIIDICLSQRPPENLPAHLLYCIGTADGLIDSAGQVKDSSSWCGAHSELIMLSEYANGFENGELVLPISETVKKLPPKTGGLDNAFAGISLYLDTRKNGAISLTMTEFSIDAADGAETVIERQRSLADEIGAKYGVKPFVTTEISAAGHHKNCYSTWVPVIDYASHGFNVGQEEAIDHVKQYGGIFSYNHPFEQYKRMPITNDMIPSIIKRDSEEYIANHVFSASLIEIGYPEGRDQFSLADHLRLWDLLSLGGVFITGYGDSDSHSNSSGWFAGNNFATWIAAEENIKFPVPEGTFIASMCAGRVFTGDPTEIRGDVSFVAENGYPTGSIIKVKSTDTCLKTLYFSMSEARPGWTVRVICDGEELLSETVKENRFRMRFSVPTSKAVSFVRVEVYREDGRCILLTNPIYYVREDEYSGEIPPEREYKKHRRFITRHGQVASVDYVRGTDGAPDFLYPIGEPVLSPLGREQAKALGVRLLREGFHGKILASPYIRTMETAEIIASVTDCPIYPCPAIREIMKTDEQAKEFRGQTEEELRALFPHMAEDARLISPWWDNTSQTWEMVIDRVKRELAPVLEEYRDDEVLLVGHGASTGAMIRCFEIPSDPDRHTGNYNCALSMFDADGISKPCYYSLSHLPYDKWTNNFKFVKDIDAERITRPWEGEISVPDSLAAYNGTKILHIGDTFSWHYPYYRKLIEAVKPDIIIHTGDLADEVKVGRIPGTECEYDFKVGLLFDILKESGAKQVYIVPGNNDKPDIIRAKAPFADVLPRNSELVIDGHHFRLGHEVTRIQFDREYVLYGHGPTGEAWELSKNKRGEHSRFNVMWGYSFVITPDGEEDCYCFERPEK